MMDACKWQYHELSNSKHLLEKMQQEYMEILDEIAADSVTDETAAMFCEVKKVLKQKMLLHQPEEMRIILTVILS